MEKINGHNQEVMVRNQGETTLGSRNTYSSSLRIGVILLCLLSITGCSLGKIKSGLITGVATTAVVGATSVLPGGVIVPALAGGVTAATASALSAPDQTKGDPIAVTAETVVQHAPDNFFTLLGKLVKMGGLATILIVLVPMAFSWLLPGPIQFKGRKKK